METWLVLAAAAAIAVVPGLVGLRAGLVVGAFGVVAIVALVAYLMFGEEQDESTPFAVLLTIGLLFGWFALVGLGLAAGAIIRSLRRRR